jgi:peptide/nickel transport system permease protein
MSTADAMVPGSLPVDRVAERPRSRRARNRSFRAGIWIFCALVLVALVAPFVAPSPTDIAIGERLTGPSGSHWLGTDGLGRDVFARLVSAARLDLALGIGACVIPFIAGGVLGLLAGYRGGWFDAVLMRIVDAVTAFPDYVLIIALVFSIGPGIPTIFVTFALIHWVPYTRIVRAETLVAKREDYVLAAQAAGLGSWRIVSRQILPNVISQPLVYSMSDIVKTILGIVTLGYLGLGVSPPTADWGTMIADGQQFMTTRPDLATVPGLMVVITGLALSLIGDGLTERLRPR